MDTQKPDIIIVPTGPSQTEEDRLVEQLNNTEATPLVELDDKQKRTARWFGYVRFEDYVYYRSGSIYRVTPQGPWVQVKTKNKTTRKDRRPLLWEAAAMEQAVQKLTTTQLESLDNLNMSEEDKNAMLQAASAEGLVLSERS